MEPIIYDIFSILSYLYSVLIAQIISGLLIVSGKGWGKIRGNGHFASAGTLFVFFVMDAVACSFLIFFASSILANFLYIHVDLAFGLTVEVLFVTFAKSCHTFGLKTKKALRKYWKWVVFSQILAILNFILVYLQYLRII